MRAFAAFFRKEISESARTYKGFIMLGVFFIIGAMSPLTAKLLPDIFNGTEISGILFNMPEPTAFDSWTQFFSNVSQIGVLTYVIVFCGITANELGKGTLVNILSKGMRRSVVIAAKFSAAACVFTVCYWLSFLTSYLYTAYFFGTSGLNGAFLAFAGPWAYGGMLISLMILGGVLTKNFYGSLFTVGGSVIVMSLLNIAPAINKFNPISLSGGTLAILNGSAQNSDFIPAVFICISATAALLAASVIAFNRKQL